MILLVIDRLLKGYDARYRWRLAFILLLSAVQTILVVLRPLPIKLLIEDAAPGSWMAAVKEWAGTPDGYLWVFAALIVGIELAILIFRLGNENASTYLSERFMRRMRDDVTANLLQGPYKQVSRIGVGRVLASVTGDVEVIQRLIKDVVVAASLSAFQLALMLGVVYTMHPALFFVLLAEIALLSVMIWVYSNWRKRTFLKQMEYQERYLGWLSNIHQKNMDLRFSQARNVFLQSAIGLVRTLFKSGTRIWIRQSMYFALVEFFLGLASAACLIFLVVESQRTGQPLGNLLVFLYYTVLVFPCLSKVGEAVPLMTDAHNAYSRLGPLLSLKTDAAPKRPRARFGRIEFRDAGLQTDQGEWIFRHLNFTVEPGDRVALFGDSGTGKSTILSLVMGFQPPSEGQVLIDGRPATDLTLAERKTLFLFQRSGAAFFNDTVGANIGLGHPFTGSPAAAILDQVRLTQRLSAIDAAGQSGVATVMTERGEPFSQGEQQRVAIARTFLSDRPCLVLDEALNSLDEATEIAIVDALLDHVAHEDPAERQTLLMITHRRTVAERAQRFFYLQRGGILTIREPGREPSAAPAVTVPSAIQP